MILKKLYDDFDLRIEPIILKEYKKLKISQAEANVLSILFSSYKKRKTFSVASIARKSDYNQDEVSDLVSSLLAKGFIEIVLEKKDEKEREVYHLDGTFQKIESLYEQEEQEKIRNKVMSNAQETIERFESEFARILRPNELEAIRSWYEKDQFKHIDILRAIDQANERLSIKYVERLLNQSIVLKPDLDEETSDALDALFKRM